MQWILVAGDADNDRSLNTVPIGKKYARINLRSHADDIIHGSEFRGQFFLAGNQRSTLGNYRNVRLKLKNFLAPLIAEAGHHAANDNHNGNAEHYTDNRNACNDRRYRTLRLKIFQREK